MAEKRNFDVETASTKSPAPIAHALNGIDFPADLDDLREQAEANGAREEILDQIGQMPDREYQSMADVFEAVDENNEEEYEAGDEEFEEDEYLEEEED